MLLPKSSGTSSSAWWISLLLLLATMLNYMDRQTLSNVSVRITEEFQLSEKQYGDLELVFGVAFAFGSLFFGMLADKLSVRWLYPAVLTAWSAMGFITGLTSTYETMLVCRTLLGFFEAGHWPCALAVTHAVLSQSDRTLGNSILQSGASFGAILTPLIIRVLVGSDQTPGAWRPPFLVIGALGVLWCIAWIAIVKPGMIVRQQRDEDSNPTAGVGNRFWLIDLVCNPRFWALVVMVISINTTWQLIRAWLPKFLQQGRGYSESEALYFNSAYFLSTDVGCILSGAAVLWMSRRGLRTHNARLIAYGVCAALTALTIAAANLPKGWPLLGVLLIVAAGSLGMFPCYYSMTQEIDSRHVGKVTGVLGFIAWMATSPLQPTFGAYVDRTGSFDLGLAIVGCIPFAGLLSVLLLWRKTPEAATDVAPDAAASEA